MLAMRHIQQSELEDFRIILERERDEVEEELSFEEEQQAMEELEELRRDVKKRLLH